MQVWRHQLLGTVVEVRAGGRDDDKVDTAVVAEIERLNLVFSAYRQDSELCRWRAGEDAAAGPDLVAVLAEAHRWHEFSGGAFHPATESLRAWWLDAQRRDCLTGDPPAAGPIPYDLVHGRPRRLGDCGGLDLNAIAKGYIVDAALEAGWRVGVDSLVVNIGGDLRHRGEGGVRVGIENPLRRADNAPPLGIYTLSNRALATSGSARRGFSIAGRWYPHVLDPRTGWPVTAVASISVVADDAMTADALATVAGVGGLDFAREIPEADWLWVGDDGTRRGGLLGGR